MARMIQCAANHFRGDESKQDGNVLALYQRMAKLRHRSLALRRGGCLVLYAEGDVVVFVRVCQQQRALVAINRGRTSAK
ncbi:maltodextrin glucosidase [Salmonella bongori]|nr:maltodextrin glucosidase [Salmonella bongori]